MKGSLSCLLIDFQVPVNNLSFIASSANRKTFTDQIHVQFGNVYRIEH